jgi:hypothetical protein
MGFILTGIAVGLQQLLKGVSYVKIVALFMLRKLWVPLVFFGSIVPGILGTYSYLRGESVEWFIAVPASFGIEFGGQLPTVLNTFQYLSDPTAGLLPLIAGVGSGVLDLYWAWYLWKKYFDLTEAEISTSKIIALFIGIFALCLAFAFTVDMYILPSENLRVSGLTYFIENPQQVVDPLSQLVSEKAAEDSVLNQTVNNTSTG